MDNKFIGLVIGLVVGILLIGSLMAPAIGEIQKTAGDKVTFSNEVRGNYSLMDYSDSLTFVRAADGTVTINGDSITDEHSGFVVASDGISIYYAFGGRLYFVDMDKSIADFGSTSAANIEVVYSNGTCTYNNITSSTTETGTYSWIYVFKVDGDYESAYFNSRGYYVSSVKDVVCTGYYGTGENDTGYTFKDGVLTLTDDYEGSVTYDLELVDGTTDVYKISNFTIHVGEESFIPWISLVPTTVEGHATSGAEYSLYGAFVVIFVAALLIFAVRFVINRD